MLTDMLGSDDGENDENLLIPVNSRLEKLIASVGDITDPSSMDKVLEVLEEIQEEDTDFIELITRKLRYETIYWEQPWYQVSLCLTRAMPLTDNNGPDTFRTDTICKEEQEIIEKNWLKFRRKYNVPDSLASLGRWKNKGKSRNPAKCPEEKARKFLVAYLARGLKRNNYQVYQFITAHYGSPVRGFYTETERKIIEICNYHKPRLIAKILAVVLGRQARGLYKTLTPNDEQEKKRLKWSLPLASKFLNSLMKHSGLQFEELKNAKIDRKIWLKVEEDMDHSYTHLQHFWYCYLHVQVFLQRHVKLNKLRRKLFKLLRDSSYKVWTDIRWKDVAMKFPEGFTPRFLYKTCSRVVAGQKGYLRKPLRKLAVSALEKLNDNKRNKRNKRLKTLALNKQGQLEIVKYSVEL